MSGEAADIIGQLKALRSTGQRLTSADKKRAEALLVTLKTKFGYSDERVDAETGGLWKDVRISRGPNSDDVGAVAKMKKSGPEQESAKQLLKAIKFEIKIAEKKYKSIQESLERYRKLQAMGFNKVSLEKIEKSAQKYGGPDQVLEAINGYVSKNELAEIIKVEKSKADKAVAKSEKLDAENAHLSHAIAMCGALLKLNYGADEIKQIYNIAKKYGEPLQVLKALDAYGKLSELKQETETITKSKIALAAQTSTMNEGLVMLQGQARAIQNEILPMLNEMKTELRSTARARADSIATTLKGEADRLTKVIDDYAETAKKAAILEDELKLARIIRAVTKYPAEMQSIPPHYAYLFLEWASKILRARGINPQVAESLGALEAIQEALASLNASAGNERDA